MKHIVLTGGGTAGHVTPNIALIPRLKELGYEISYIGSYDGIEKKLIEENCYEHIILEECSNFKYKKQELWTSILEYITSNKSMVLDGFVTFRLGNYLSTLEEIVDNSVNEYVIEKEYTEFINLLKLYIDAKEPVSSIIHLIYTNGNSILLNENKNVINLKDNNFNAKYLSDISFFLFR